MRCACAAFLIGVLSLGACSEMRRSEPEPVELPHWRECTQRSGGDVDALFKANDRGEAFAILCGLALDEGPDLPRADFKNLYRLYRIGGREPEGLDERVRRFDRTEVSTAINPLCFLQIRSIL